MKRLINFFGRIYADLLAGRALLHPILLTAAFLAAKFGALYVIDEKILGSGYDLGIFGEFAYYIWLCVKIVLLFKLYFARIYTLKIAIRAVKWQLLKQNLKS